MKINNKIKVYRFGCLLTNNKRENPGLFAPIKVSTAKFIEEIYMFVVTVAN